MDDVMNVKSRHRRQLIIRAGNGKSQRGEEANKPSIGGNMSYRFSVCMVYAPRWR